MSTPNPALQVAAPVLIKALTDLQTCVNTILTGDPMQLPMRVSGATDILIGQIKLLLPELAADGEAALQADVNTKLGDLITKLQNLAKPS